MKNYSTEEFIGMLKSVARKFKDSPDRKMWYVDRVSRLPREYYYRVDDIIENSKNLGEIIDGVYKLLNELEIPIVTNY